MSATCRSCGAEILWAITAKGKRMPVDRAPSDQGNVILHAEGETLRAEVLKADAIPLWTGDLRHTSHFATCPNAKGHRR